MGDVHWAADKERAVRLASGDEHLQRRLEVASVILRDRIDLVEQRGSGLEHPRDEEEAG